MGISRFKRRISLLTLALALATSPVAQAASLPAHEHDQLVSKEIGRILATNELPAEIWRFIKEAEGRLGSATEKVLARVLGDGGRYRQRFDVKIVSSPEINALMVSDEARDLGRTSVYLTTAMLKTLLADDAQPGVLDGILAHEFGHLIDKLDPRGVEATARSQSEPLMAKYLAQPTIELVTDSYAEEILVESGRDPGALTRALAWIDRHVAQRGSSVEGLLSSHPRSGFRQTHARLTAFGWRFIAGHAAAPAPGGDGVSPTLRAAATRIPVTSGYPKVDLPQVETIEDVIRELRKFDPQTPRIKPEPNDIPGIRFSYLQHRLIEILHSKPKLSTPEKALLAGWLAQVSENKSYANRFRGDYFTLQTWRDGKEPRPTLPKDHPLAFLFPDRLDLQVQSCRHFDDPELLSLIARSYLSPPKTTAEFRSRMSALGRWVKHAALDRVSGGVFQRSLAHEARHLARATAFPSYSYASRNTSDVPIAFTGQSIPLSEFGFYNPYPGEITQHLIPELGWSEWASLNLFSSHAVGFTTRNARDPSESIHVTSRHKDRVKRLARQPGYVPSLDHATPQVLEDYRKLAGTYWDDPITRAKWAIAEILADSEVQIDWLTIWERLGIPREQGVAELNQAVLDSAQRGQLPDFLKIFPPIFYAHDPAMPKVPLFWLEAKTADTLRGLAGSADRSGFFKKRLLHANPETLNRRFVEEMRARLRAPAHVDADHVVKASNDALGMIFGTRLFDGQEARLDSKWPLSIQAHFLKWVLDASEDRPAADRRRLIELIFRDLDHDGTQNPVWHWLNVQPLAAQREVIQKITELFPERGVSWLQELAEKTAKAPQTAFVDRFQDFYEREIDSWRKIPNPRDRAQAYAQFAKIVFDSDQKRLEAREPYFRLADRFHAALARERFTAAEFAEILAASLKSGPTEQTDRLIRTHLARGTEFSADQLLRFLSKERIRDLGLNIALAKRALEPVLRSLHRPPTEGEVLFLAKIVDEILPGFNGPRDRLLEELSWWLGIQDLKPLRSLSALKTFGARRQAASPVLVRALSGLDGFLDELRPSDIEVIWRYVDRPTRGELPDRIRFLIDQHIRSEARNLDASEGLANELTKLREKIEGPLKLTAERLSREEKIPLFTHLLETGARPMAGNPDFIPRFLDDKLGIEPNSEKGRFLRAFLASIERDDRPIALSYLFATQGKGEFKPSEIFQIFGTPGKKAAQIAALWDLFPGDQQALNQIKEKAEPLALLEMKEILSREAPDLYAHLELHSILGSASIKTMVKARDRRTGQWLALAVANPRARAQTQAHFDLARRMLGHLDEFGLTHHSERFQKLAEQSEELVLGELSMTDEARKTAHAGQVFSKIGPKGGWRFAPPGIANGYPTTEHVAVFDFIQAPGSLESLGKFAGHVEAKRAIAEATVEGIFVHGWIQMDPHAGNFLIDPVSRTIHPLDFGQTYQLKGGLGMQDTNEILEVGQFLRRYAEGDAGGLIEAASALAKGTKPQPGVVDAVEGFFRTHSANRYHERALFELFDVLEAQGLRLPTQMTLGILKPLATILREGYVTETELAELLKISIEAGIRHQGLALGIGELRKEFLRFCRRVTRRKS